jgi:hypothetical protein
VSELRRLLRHFATTGRIEAIVLRPARDRPALSVAATQALAGRGLDGDRSAAHGAAHGSARASARSRCCRPSTCR